MRAVALIDGEHAPDVVTRALAELPYEWVGAILVGGSEKLRPERRLRRAARRGLRRRRGRRRSLRRAGARPGRALRLGLAGARGRARLHRRRLPLRAALLRGDRPAVDRRDRHRQAGREDGGLGPPRPPARARARGRASSRWAAAGPPEPELVETPPGVEELVALSRSGRHAASDHLEIAAVAGVPTIGCRRAGGGLAGRLFVSNVAEGARLAERHGRRAWSSSTGAAPRSRRSRRPAGARRRPGHDLSAHFNVYRRLISDLVVSVGCEVEGAIPATLRLRAARAARRARRRLHGRAGADRAPRGRRRPRLAQPRRPRPRCARELAPLEADTYLIELKGAAIDLVAEHALARGRRVVLAGNDVVAPGLDEALLALLPEAVPA